MECCRQLDAVGRSAAVWRIILAVVLILLSIWTSTPVEAQSSRSPANEQEIKQLFEQQRWQDLVRELQQNANLSADFTYYFGTALAQLSRWDEARAALLTGLRSWPKDKRFPTELAGVAFRQKNYKEARRWLRQVLRLDHDDIYVKDFLGTLYFLEGNLEAALKYWNQISKPEIQNVLLDPQPRMNSALLDRAFAFSPAGVLRSPDLLLSESRVRGLEVFSSPRFELAARPDGKFDAVFRARERNGWGSNKWEALASTFSGVFYQTLYPAYFNIDRSAINVTSLLRWDSQKRRLQISVSSPLLQNPKFRFRAALDLRNENWDIRDSFQGPAPLLGVLNLEREGVVADVTSFSSGRWSWSTGLELSHRKHRSVLAGSAFTPELLLSGYQLKHLAQLNHEILRIPEHRFTTTASVSEQTGKIWSTPGHPFEKLSGKVQGQWFPRSQGDDYESRWMIGAGSIFGEVPFDELYMLGLERDNDLWMRGHIGTRDGKKGSAPLGRSYSLLNWETFKNVYSNGIFGLKVGPFADTGKINGSTGLGSKKWLLDMGVQAKFTVLGVGVVFIYGKDLRSGNNASYATVGQ